MIPFLSMMTIARSAVPSERKIPYRDATAPCGQKSERTSNQRCPIWLVQEYKVGILSTEIPSNTASCSSNRSFTILYPGHWSEHTGVQAAGTKESTTFFLPM